MMEYEAYCATCRKVIKETDHKHLVGRPYKCPHGPDHYAAITKKSGKGWLDFEYELVRWNERHPRWTQLPVGVYSLVRGTIVLLVLGGVLDCLPGVPPVIASIAAIDIVIGSLVTAFINVYPARPLRSVLLTFFAYFQLCLCFAVWYKYVLAKGAFSAFYISVTTAVTVGPGLEIVVPASGLLSCKLPAYPLIVLVTAQLFSAIFFLSVLVSIISGYAGRSKEAPVDDKELITGQSTCSAPSRA
jgi:hypothetical protein